MGAGGKTESYLSVGNGGGLHWASSGPRRLGSWTVGGWEEDLRGSAGHQVVRV